MSRQHTWRGDSQHYGKIDVFRCTRDAPCRHGKPTDQRIRLKQAVLTGTFKSRNDLAQDFGKPARLSSRQTSDKYNAIVNRSSGVIRLARSTFSFASRSLNLLGRRWRPVGIGGCRGFLRASIHRSLAREQHRMDLYRGPGTTAMILSGPPVPPAIFMGNAITSKPRMGRLWRLARFSNTGTSWESKATWVSNVVDWP